jgi:hypothetical protein
MISISICLLWCQEKKFTKQKIDDGYVSILWCQREEVYWIYQQAPEFCCNLKQYTFERNALRSSLRNHPHLQIWFIRLMWWWWFSLASQMLLHIGTCHLTFQPHELVLVRWVFCTSLQLWNWVMTPVEMCVSLLFWYQQLQILFGFRFNCCYNYSNPRFLVMQCRLGI